GRPQNRRSPPPDHQPEDGAPPPGGWPPPPRRSPPSPLRYCQSARGLLPSFERSTNRGLAKHSPPAAAVHLHERALGRAPRGCLPTPPRRSSRQPVGHPSL